MNLDRFSPLERHFIAHGYKLGWTGKRIDSRLRQLMGSVRRERQLDVLDAVIAGSRPISDAYATCETAEEAALLLSSQSDVVIASYEWINRCVSDSCGADAVILEVGCWTGTFTAWIAQRLPGAIVIGADAGVRAVDIARRTHVGLDLEFMVWDHTGECPAAIAGRCSHVVASFAIDYSIPAERQGSQGGPIEGDMESLSTSPYYLQSRRPFAGWRRATAESATLYFVGRLPSATAVAGCVTAAHEVGWTWLPERSSIIKVGEERFPALVFVSGQGATTPDCLVETWYGGLAAAAHRAT